MKTISKLVLVILLALVAIPGYTQAIPAKRIFLGDVNMDCQWYGDSNERLRMRLQSRLQQLGWTILARGSGYENITAEWNLPGVDPNTKVSPGQNTLWGATLLLEARATTTMFESGGGGGININGYSMGGGGGRRYLKGELNLQLKDVRTGEYKPAIVVEKITGYSTGGDFHLELPVLNGISLDSHNRVDNAEEAATMVLIDMMADEGAARLDTEDTKVVEVQVPVVTPITTQNESVAIYAQTGAIVRILYSSGSAWATLGPFRISAEGVGKIHDLDQGVFVRIQVLSPDGSIQREKKGMVPCAIQFP